MTTQEAVGRLQELAERFSRCAERVRLDDPLVAEHSLSEEAGEIVVAMLRSGGLPDPTNLLVHFDEADAERRRIEQVPHHLRQHPDVFDPVSPFRQVFALYADTVLVHAVTLPPGGLSSFQTVGMDGREAAAMMGARLRGGARCCRALAELVAKHRGDPAGGGRNHRQAAKLPVLKAHDRQAWQLAMLQGMTQDKVAAALNAEYGTTYTQGQVSRMIARAKAHAEANGLAEKVAAPIDRPHSVDPGRLELGARVDTREPRPSDLARANDDNE